MWHTRAPKVSQICVCPEECEKCHSQNDLVSAAQKIELRKKKKVCKSRQKLFSKNVCKIDLFQGVKKSRRGAMTQNRSESHCFEVFCVFLPLRVCRHAPRRRRRKRTARKSLKTKKCAKSLQNGLFAKGPIPPLRWEKCTMYNCSPQFRTTSKWFQKARAAYSLFPGRLLLSPTRNPELFQIRENEIFGGKPTKKQNWRGIWPKFWSPERNLGKFLSRDLLFLANFIFPLVSKLSGFWVGFNTAYELINPESMSRILTH